MLSFSPHILKEKRVAAGYETEAEAARALGVTRQQYSIWERGIHAPSALWLGRISQLYECKIDDLFCEDQRDEKGVA